MSWIVIRKSDGKAVCELWTPNAARSVNREKYEVLTALAYLQRLNAGIFNAQCMGEPV